MHSTVLSFALLSLVSSAICALQKCCPDGHCYDLGPPWATLTRPAPPPKCIPDPARYLLTTRMVQTLIDLGTPPSQIHLIGLSLGAHVASYVGKAIPGIGRITGLDPAGPMFTGQSCKVRLCKDDANFTEAIHTNGGAVLGWGTRDADAQVNFWVNGGWDQPECGFLIDPLFFLRLGKPQGIEGELEIYAGGCCNGHSQLTKRDQPALQVVDVAVLLFCSHGRSLFYYTEALASNCTFWGLRPNDFTLSTRRSFHTSSGAQRTVYTALGIVKLFCCLPLEWVISNSSTLAVGSRKARQYKMLSVQFFEFLMMGGNTA